MLRRTPGRKDSIKLISDPSLPLETRLEIERVNTLFEQNLPGLLALLFCGALYAVVTRDYNSPLFLISWLVVLVGSAIARLLFTMKWKKIRNSVRTTAEAHRWLHRLHALLFVSGALWGAISLQIPFTDSDYKRVVTSIVVHWMGQGAVVAYSASLPAMLLVYFPAFIPLAVSCLITGDPVYQTMGGGLTFLIAVGVLSGRGHNRYAMNSMRLTVENDKMAIDLRNQIAIKNQAMEAEAANRAKSIFLANASHEIRTPLAAINGFADLALQSKDLSTNAKRDLEMISRNGKYLISLVNDLLDLSRIESDQFYIQRNRMAVIDEIHDVVATLKPNFDAKNLEFDLTFESRVPEHVRTDVTRFREVLINVIGNACKFTDHGRVDVFVRFEPLEGGDGLLRIRVKDTGVGISPEVLKNLFQPFVRGMTMIVQRNQGSGLGLALSKKLTGLLGGDLTLVSTKDGYGSEFEFSVLTGNVAEERMVLPDDLARRNVDSKPQATETPKLEGKDILVVDDSPDLIVLMKRFLEKHGARVEVRVNGQEAVDRVRERRFDMILMDIKMPVMDGYEAIRILRATGYSDLVIALTAHASTEDRERCRAAGFDHYVSKPVDLKSLLHDLTTIPSRHQHEGRSLYS